MKNIRTVAVLLTATLSLSACGGGGGGGTATPDTTAPTITLTAPDTVTVAGAVKLSAAASDNVGVTRVIFYRGAAEISTDATAPYEATGNVTAADNGTVQYRAVAFDAAGNSNEATGDVTVNISATPPTDITAPSIVSITPASGATGVATDANIVVTFSEPMNQATTQASYHSSDLPAFDVTFSWNADSTVLTINSKSGLIYTSTGKTHTFFLEGATDLAGNVLPLASSSFKTFKQISTTVYSAATLDGDVRDDGQVNTSNLTLRIGDDGIGGNGHHGYLSFDLGGLPPIGANLTSATLKVYQSSVVGSPYTDLVVAGNTLVLDHVYYGFTLTPDDFNPTVYGDLGNTVSNIIRSPAIGSYSTSVLNALRADLNAHRAYSQYRLSFNRLRDGDKYYDMAFLASGDSATNKPSLEITYLIP